MKISALISLALLSVIACKKDSRVDDGIADVYVKTILVNGQLKYGVSHLFMGYSAMSQVTVSLPDLTTEQLSSYDNSYTLFYADPTVANGGFSSTLPAQGTFTYNVKFNDGVEKTYTDQLSGNYLLPPTITSIVKSDDGARVNLSWAIDGTDLYYRFKVIKNGTIIFTSDLFALKDPTNQYIEIPNTAISSYMSGTYTYELHAYKYQSLEVGTLQSESSASADITF